MIASLFSRRCESYMI